MEQLLETAHRRFDHGTQRLRAKGFFFNLGIPKQTAYSTARLAEEQKATLRRITKGGHLPEVIVVTDTSRHVEAGSLIYPDKQRLPDRIDVHNYPELVGGILVRSPHGLPALAPPGDPILARYDGISAPIVRLDQAHKRDLQMYLLSPSGKPPPARWEDLAVHSSRVLAPGGGGSLADIFPVAAHHVARGSPEATRLAALAKKMKDFVWSERGANNGARGGVDLIWQCAAANCGND